MLRTIHDRLCALADDLKAGRTNPRDAEVDASTYILNKFTEACPNGVFAVRARPAAIMGEWVIQPEIAARNEEAINFLKELNVEVTAESSNTDDVESGLYDWAFGNRR